MFVHPEYGEASFDKIYFEMEKPVLFVAGFEKIDEKFVGIQIENYEHPFQKGMHFYLYYFAGVSDNEIRHLQTTKGALKEFFETRPLWFLQHRDDMGVMEDKWEQHSELDSLYCFTEKASLC